MGTADVTIGQRVDRIFLLLCLVVGPLVAYLFSLAINGIYIGDATIDLNSVKVTVNPAHLLMLSVTQGHVLLIFHRCLLVPEVYQKYKAKILLGIAGVFLVSFTSATGYLLVTLLNAFWLHFHFMAQNFGVQRMLMGTKDRHSYERRLDYAFIALTFFVPPMSSEPGLLFDPASLSELLGAMGARHLAYPLLSLLEFATNLAYDLRYPVWILTPIYLIWLSRRSSAKGVYFAASLALVSWIGWSVSSSMIGLATYIMVHSMQYYFIVIRTAPASSSLRRSIIGVGLILLATIFGMIYPVFGSSDFKAVSATFESRWLLGTVQAVNLIHFWMDGFVWKRDTFRAA